MTTTRRCGGCQECCRLLPTMEIAKPALQRCPHQKHGTGCAIYARRPMSCQLWSCRWLVDSSTGDLPRPDRSHLVVDLIPDFITITHHDGSPPDHMEVIQVWIDPAHKLAHRAPAFRRWLDQQGKPALIRYSPRDGFVLFPPSTNTGGQWVEEMSGITGREHSLEEKAAALGGSIEIGLVDDEGNAAVYQTTLKIGDQSFAAGTLDAGSEDRRQEIRANAQRLREEREAMLRRAEGER
jgi:hypothetical protein